MISIWPPRLEKKNHDCKFFTHRKSLDASCISEITGILVLLTYHIYNVSVIMWRLVLLMEETEVPGENHRSAASHLQTL
jgi:hypothetical protein